MNKFISTFINLKKHAPSNPDWPLAVFMTLAGVRNDDWYSVYVNFELSGTLVISQSVT